MSEDLICRLCEHLCLSEIDLEEHIDTHHSDIFIASNMKTVQKAGPSNKPVTPRAGPSNQQVQPGTGRKQLDKSYKQKVEQSLRSQSKSSTPKAKPIQTTNAAKDLTGPSQDQVTK